MGWRLFLFARRWNKDLDQFRVAATLSQIARARMSGESELELSNRETGLLKDLGRSGRSTAEESDRLQHALSLLKLAAPPDVYWHARLCVERMNARQDLAVDAGS